MDAIEIYRTSNCLISLNPDIPAIELAGTGYINSPQLRESCNLTAPLLIEHRISKLLIDVKEMFMIGLGDQIWAATTWVPGLIKAGLTSVAIINSKYYFQRLAIEAIVSRLDQSKLTITYFDHKNEAVAWLKSLGQ